MNAQERLRFAERARKEGRYEEALRELIWFHDHALAEQRSLYGVRLSYALSYWASLGRVYPPARHALDEVRERKAELLLRGAGSFELFHDVVSIDRALDAFSATRDLYLALMAQQPEFAAQYAALALPGIAQARDIALLRRVRPDPAAEIRRHAAHLHEMVRMFKHARYPGFPRRRMHASTYAGGVRRVTAISALIGDHEEVRRLQALALDLIHDPSLRRDVRAELAGWGRPPPGLGKRWRWREHRRGRRRAA